jgi:hypothetical protein
MQPCYPQYQDLLYPEYNIIIYIYSIYIWSSIPAVIPLSIFLLIRCPNGAKWVLFRSGDWPGLSCSYRCRQLGELTGIYWRVEGSMTGQIESKCQPPLDLPQGYYMLQQPIILLHFLCLYPPQLSYIPDKGPVNTNILRYTRCKAALFDFKSWKEG